MGESVTVRRNTPPWRASSVTSLTSEMVKRHSTKGARQPNCTRNVSSRSLRPWRKLCHPLAGLSAVQWPRLTRNASKGHSKTPASALLTRHQPPQPKTPILHCNRLCTADEGTTVAAVYRWKLAATARRPPPLPARPRCRGHCRAALLPSLPAL